jgi:acetolactate synthase-1/2/3 large subunit
MRSGRPGPVSIEMPWDQFSAAAEVTPQDPLPPHAAPVPDPVRIAELADKVKAARCPMIWVGGGAMEAGAEVLALAERIGAPVVSFRSGRGIVSDRHALAMTVPAAWRLWEETDLLIGIGSRLEVPLGRWGRRPANLTVARIDIDPVEMRRLAVEIGVVADAADGARALLAALGPGAPAAGRAEAIARAKAATAVAIRGVQPQMAYLEAIRDALPDDGIFCDEMTQVGYVSWFGLPVYRPRSLITSGFSGTLGAGFPTALGVKVAHPDRPVVAVTGDGGFLFGGTELATAMQHGINLVTVLFNNSAYGNVLRDQKRLYEGRESGSALRNPDFQAFARSFGVRAWHAADAEDLRTALREAIAANAPALIEVTTDIGRETPPWEFISPGRK